MSRQNIRRCVVVALAAVSVGSIEVGTLGQAPAEASHAEVVVTSGLGGFVASATGYATPEIDALECLGHEAVPCSAASQEFDAPTPAEAADWVAGSVTP